MNRPLPDTWRGRAIAAVVATLLAVFVGVLAVAPGVAHAENEVLSSEPANGAVLQSSPTEVVFTFAEEVGELRIVTLVCETEPFTLDRPTLSGNNRVMTATINEVLPKGLCVASWRVADLDGEPNGDGLISFNIETDATQTTTDPAGDATASTTVPTTDAGTDTAAAASDDVEIVALNRVDTGKGPLWLGRLLSTLGIAVLFGSLIVIAAAWPEGVEYMITIRFLRAAWLLAVIGTLLYTAAAAGAVTGSSLGAGFSPSSWFDLLDAGWSGRAALLRLIFVVAAAWAAWAPERVIDPVTQLAALGVPALAVAMIGVGRADGDFAAIGVALGIVHAFAMAVWAGGVILLARVVLAGPGEEDLVHAVRGFGRISVVAIIVTIVTGFGQMLRLDGGNLFNSGHGRVVVLKVVLVAAMVFIGISARQFAQRRLARTHELTVPMADRLKRAFGTEAALGLLTLMASSWLLALAPPNVSAEPSIRYAIERRIEIEEAGVDVTVKLTRSTIGPAGLEVRVDAPEEGLTGLEVMLTRPDGGTIVQPVPLRSPGRAVRLESAGLPLDQAGEWLLQINVATADGAVVQSTPLLLEILNPDGTAPTTSITVPPSILVPIDPTTTVAGG